MQPDDVLREAVLAHRAGRLAAAELGYRRVLRARPRDARALHFLGLLVFHQNDVEGGIRCLSQSLESEPNNGRGWNALGGMYMAAERRSEASQAYQRSTEVAPDLAEGWYNLAICLRNEGDAESALTQLREAIRRDAGYSRAYEALAMLLYQMGRMSEAAGVYSEWIAHDPQNATARYMAAATSGEDVPTRAPDDYVRDLFDETAAAFDSKLAQLQYRAPQLVADALRRRLGRVPLAAPIPLTAEAPVAAQTALGTGTSLDRQTALGKGTSLDRQTALGKGTSPDRQSSRSPTDSLQPADDVSLGSVLDAGCGTGLCGPLLRPHCRQLVGIDLSPKMIERARVRGCYDELITSELSAFMRAHPQSFDAVISADTLVYFGALEEPLAAAYTALRPGGCVVFTLEALSDWTDHPNHRLQFHGRYAHSENYARASLTNAGFALEHLSRETLRQEANQDVQGLLVVGIRQS